MPELGDRAAVTIKVTSAVAPAPPPRLTTPAPSSDPAPAGGGSAEPGPSTRSQAPRPPGSPRARRDRARATTLAGVTIAVLENDLIPLGETVAVSVGRAEHGAVRVLPDGSIHYTPEPGFDGSDHFRYTITGLGGRSSAVVDVVVQLPEPIAATWPGGPLLGAAVARDTPEGSAPALRTGFLLMARTLLETIQSLNTPVRMLLLAAAWIAIFTLLLTGFRRRRAFLVEGVGRGGALDVVDRPGGECRYRLRYDDGPVWSIGRRRTVDGRIWVPVAGRLGSGFVELDRLLAVDAASDPPRSIL
jgi:Big-like domain-containing protein